MLPDISTTYIPLPDSSPPRLFLPYFSPPDTSPPHSPSPDFSPSESTSHATPLIIYLPDSSSPKSKNLINTHRIATENIFRYNKAEKGFEVGLEGHNIFLIKNDLGSNYFHDFFIPQPYHQFLASYVVLEHREPNSYERYENTLTACGKICDRETVNQIRESLKVCEKEIKAAKRSGDKKLLMQLENDRRHNTSFLQSALKKNGDIRDLDDLRECLRTSFFMAIFRTLEKFLSCDKALYDHFKSCMTLGREPKYDPPTGTIWNTAEVL